MRLGLCSRLVKNLSVTLGPLSFRLINKKLRGRIIGSFKVSTGTVMVARVTRVKIGNEAGNGQVTSSGIRRGGGNASSQHTRVRILRPQGGPSQARSLRSSRIIRVYLAFTNFTLPLPRLQLQIAHPLRRRQEGFLPLLASVIATPLFRRKAPANER